MTEQALARHLLLGGGWKDEASHGFHCCTNYSFITLLFAPSIPVTARSKAWVSGLSLAGFAGSNLAVFTAVCIL